MNSNEQPKQILHKLAEIYVTYRQRYILCLSQGTILVPKNKNGDYSRLTNGVLYRHLNHNYAVGIYAGNWGSKFVCFDVDDGSEDTVRAIISRLSAMGLPRHKIYVSLSGGKGYHVELFFDRIVSTVLLHRLYSHVVTVEGQDPKKVEFRPTNTAAIKLPLSVHAKTGRVCWYVDAETMIPVEDQAFILGIQQIPAALVEELEIPQADSLNQESQSTNDSRGGASSEETRNLGTILTEVGTRHNMMRNIIVHERCNGTPREECEAKLRLWLEQQDHSCIRTPEPDVLVDMEEMINWVYSDRFIVNADSNGTLSSKDQTTLSRSQLRWILKAKGRSSRRVLFLLFLRCRMNRQVMSVNDMCKALGVSKTIISKAIKRLLEDGQLKRTDGRRLKLPDGSYRREYTRYAVPYVNPYDGEPMITITMRELIFDFDECYFSALDRLIPQYMIREILTKCEWKEYEKDRRERMRNIAAEIPRIDLIGMQHELEHIQYGRMTAYKVNGRMLYPACEVCKCLKLSDPSQRGSMCKGKESWNVEVQLKGWHSPKAVRRNYIPAEDVRMLAECSHDDAANDICRWILSEENMENAQI